MPAAPKKPAMPKWQKAPPALVERFHVVIGSVPGAQVRMMFGYPAAFLGGHMFTGLFQDRMVLRLPEAPRAGLLALAGAAPFEPIKGRPMREYVVAPPALVDSDRELLPWLRQAADHARSLPAKPPKARGGSARQAGGARARKPAKRS